jgi:hypothetical protein
MACWKETCGGNGYGRALELKKCRYGYEIMLNGSQYFYILSRLDALVHPGLYQLTTWILQSLLLGIAFIYRASWSGIQITS